MLGLSIKKARLVSLVKHVTLVQLTVDNMLDLSIKKLNTLL